MKNILFILMLSALFLTSCNREERQLEDDKELIEAYLTENNLTAEMTEEGVYYIVTKQGNGEYPTLASQVTVEYRGYLLDGSVFEENTATFPLSGVILGWQIGIPQFDKGGEGTILIPSGLAYGPSGQGSIPGNTVLIFDVKLLDL